MGEDAFDRGNQFAFREPRQIDKRPNNGIKSEQSILNGVQKCRTWFAHWLSCRYELSSKVRAEHSTLTSISSQPTPKRTCCQRKVLIDTRENNPTDSSSVSSVTYSFFCYWKASDPPDKHSRSLGTQPVPRVSFGSSTPVHARTTRTHSSTRIDKTRQDKIARMACFRGAEHSAGRR